MRPPFFLKTISMSVNLRTDCLDDVIGLSRTECECFEVPTAESQSGLFLDEIEGLDLVGISSAADCTAGDVWDLMRKSREQAILAFKTDLAAKLATTYKQSRKTFRGNIGRDAVTGNESVDSITGLRMLFSPVKNGVFIVKRIGLLFAQTGTLNLKIYNNVDQDPIYEYNGLETQANRIKWNTLDEPISLPMYDTVPDYLQYFFVYEDPGFAPKNNKLTCGCGPAIAAISFCCTKPNFNLSMNDERFTWNQWAEVTGVKGASIDAIRDADSTFTDLAYGLLIDGEMKCNMKDISCNDLDFDNSEIALVTAYAIRYRAGQFLIDNILASGNINRYTMLDRERMYGKKNSYAKEYATRIDWLTENIDWRSTGCLSCIERMTKRSLI